MTGGSVSGKIVHLSDAGLVINAVTGALGGVAGGQLISHILGNTAVATGWDPGAFIGPFFDGALAGDLCKSPPAWFSPGCCCMIDTGATHRIISARFWETGRMFSSPAPEHIGSPGFAGPGLAKRSWRGRS
ncbi:hypothetical protein HGG75_24690 [Ochrobactrum pseudogrignonense]|nr:hypothetical protein [Brucella pseudogrignonensis]